MKIQEVLSTNNIKLTKYQKVFLSNNSNQDWPLCKCGCQQPVLLNYTDSNAVFREFASAQCSRKSKTISSEVENLLKNYDWLYDQRFVQKKSKELIAEELGISITPINKWLKFHNLNHLRLNESEHKIQQVLNDKQFLQEEYDKFKTLKDIASSIGTSTATLSSFFSRHNITTRTGNDYDRKNFKSKEEMQLYNWICSVLSSDTEVRSGDRKTIGKELDVYIPSLGLAVEYNGIFSHMYRPDAKTEEAKKGPSFHLNKTIKCQDKGIQLIHIFSDQWTKNPDAVKTILMAKLGINKKIFARKCTIKIPSVHEKNEFLNKYHLQGADKSKFHYGLYHNDELVSIMTFGISRYNKNYKWELVRYCGKMGITVVGGFSKLLKNFTKNNMGSIVSYADRCYSDGNVYQKNGFVLTKINKPSYHYLNLNKNIRVNRRMYTKKRILEMLKLSSSQKSESELTKELGIDKIFDCGTLTYILEN